MEAISLIAEGALYNPAPPNYSGPRKTTLLAMAIKLTRLGQRWRSTSRQVHFLVGNYISFDKFSLEYQINRIWRIIGDEWKVVVIIHWYWIGGKTLSTQIMTSFSKAFIDGLEQDCSNSMAKPMTRWLTQSCGKPLECITQMSEELLQGNGGGECIHITKCLSTQMPGTRFDIKIVLSL